MKTSKPIPYSNETSMRNTSENKINPIISLNFSNINSLESSEYKLPNL